jgi:hypothetical protein
LGISIIFITGLAKWFSRYHLLIIIGVWLTNEFVAFEIFKNLESAKNELLTISGVLLCLSSILIYKFYKFDPIDANLLINEQAIYLTTQYTDTFREYVTLEEFLNEMKMSNIDKSSKKFKDESYMIEYETRILKRWKTLSFLQTLRLNGIIRMMIISCLIFFKYRIVNKMAVIISIKNEEDKPDGQKLSLFGCFLLASQTLLLILGYIIFKYLKGRRYIVQALLLALSLALELT